MAAATTKLPIVSTYNQVTHKNHCGSLILTSEGLIMQDDNNAVLVELVWGDIGKVVCNPPDKPTPKLKVTHVDGSPNYIFKFQVHDMLNQVKSEMNKRMNVHLDLRQRMRDNSYADMTESHKTNGHEVKRPTAAGATPVKEQARASGSPKAVQGSTTAPKPVPPSAPSAVPIGTKRTTNPKFDKKNKSRKSAAYVPIVTHTKPHNNKNLVVIDIGVGRPGWTDPWGWELWVDREYSILLRDYISQAELEVFADEADEALTASKLTVGGILGNCLAVLCCCMPVFCVKPMEDKAAERALGELVWVSKQWNDKFASEGKAVQILVKAKFRKMNARHELRTDGTIDAHLDNVERMNAIDFEAWLEVEIL